LSKFVYQIDKFLYIILDKILDKSGYLCYANLGDMGIWGYLGYGDLTIWGFGGRPLVPKMITRLI
jgi:hypothetical protein